MRFNASGVARAVDPCADGGAVDRCLLHEIDVLTEANRRVPDVRREQRLVALRNAAVAELPHQPGRRVWPPDLADPFPGALLPEIAADEVSVATVGGAVLHHGAVIARGLLDDRSVARLIECIDRALDRNDSGKSSRRRHDEWFTPFGVRPPMLALGEDWTRMIDSPRSTFEYVEIMSPLVRSLVTPYLGERPVMDSHKWTLRRIPPDAGGQWHQDGRFLGGEVRVLSVWIALTRCGGREPASGLQVVPKRLELLPGGTEGAFFDWSIGPPLVERVAEGAMLDPVYEAGDALIFDHRTVHRTGARPGLTRTRYAIEAWFFAPSARYDPERTFVF